MGLAFFKIFTHAMHPNYSFPSIHSSHFPSLPLLPPDPCRLHFPQKRDLLFLRVMCFKGSCQNIKISIKRRTGRKVCLVTKVEIVMKENKNLLSKCSTPIEPAIYTFKWHAIHSY